MRRLYINLICVTIAALFSGLASAQCELYDFYGNPSATPYWYSCSGGDFDLSIQSPNSLGSWTIDWGDGNSDSGTDLVPPNAITHTYAAAVDSFIVVFTEISTGCTVQGVVIMEEATSASIQIPVGGLTQACAPQTMEFINSSTNTSETTVFTWDFGDGSPIEVYDYTNLGQTISHTYEVGTVDCETVVTLTAENYCNTVQGGPSAATFNPIRIWDIDDAAITASETVLCYPDNEVTFTNTTERNCLLQGNIYQRYEYWNFGDYWGEGQDSIIDWRAWPPTFPHTLQYPGIGSYTVTLLDSNLCGIDMATITIQIVPPPTADAAASAMTVCAGEVVTFTNNSSANATNHVWDFDDGTPLVYSGANTVDHAFQNAGSYNVSLVSAVGGLASGCSDTTFVPITVLPAPEAVIVLDNTEDCDSIQVNFTDNSTGSISTWDWSFGNGNTSTSQNPGSEWYVGPGVYNAVLTVEGINGCINSDSEIITVHESPIADFVVNDICIGSEGTMTDLSSSPGGDPIVDWDWNFGDGNGSTDQNPTHTYNVAGSYFISLTVNTGTCSASTTTSVTVQDAPTSDFVQDEVAGCGPLEVNFTNQSSDADNYSWVYGDGSGTADENPTQIFQNFGDVDSVYAVTLIARNAFGCADTSTSQVTVHPTAVSQFQTFYTPGCSPSPSNFLNNSVNATDYEWDFGDGTPVTDEVNPSHVFINTGLTLQTFEISLVATTPFGCDDTSTASVAVYPEPSFDFTLEGDTGCAPFVANFPVISGAVSTYWSFGDGTISTAPNPSHAYANNTLAPITYEAEMVGTSAFGCTDTATALVVVNPNPIAQFSASPTAGCSPVKVNLENQSLLADSVHWTYGDGFSSDTMAVTHAHTFENNTNQTVVYTVVLEVFTENGCSETFTRNIEVHPAVIADFEHPDDGCAPLGFTFENTSQNASLYQWDLGNGIVSVAEEPMAGYDVNTFEPDTFDIQLVATSLFGCEDTARSSIIVYPKPQASFLPNTTAGCGPLDVEFQNNSSIADSYTWIYGNGQTSDTTAATHEHTFTTTSTVPVDYEVTLIASSDYGCSDSASVEIMVYPDVDAAFTHNPDSGCSPLSVSFVNQSFGGATYAWDFGDETTAFIQNPNHVFVNSTDSLVTFDVEMIAQSGFGCTDTTYSEVVVYPLPSINAVISEIDGCYPADVTFANFSEGAESFTWDYGDGASSTESDSLHVHQYVNPGVEVETYTVTLTGVSDYGCEASTMFDMDIIPQIIASVNPPLGGCSPYIAEFENNSIGAMTYYWDFGDGVTSQEVDPVHAYNNANSEDSTYTVLFVAQSLWGCGDTLEFEIPVLGQPNAGFVAAPLVQQFPESTIDVINLSSANDGSEYAWSWGDGNTTTSTDPSDPNTYTYDTWGEFDISLVVGSSICSDTATQSVTILPPLPIADFEGEGIGCLPLVVAFESTSTYAESYLWDFGDGTNSNEANPVHTYYQVGTFNVTLTVTGPGGDQDIEIRTGIVTVHPRAEAYFTVNPPVISIPDDVFFLNLSQNADTYHWDFGDGQTSDEFSPYHFYETLGWHPVTLIANNEFNCPDTFAIEQAILGNVDSQISFPNAFTPNPNGSNGGYWTLDDMFNNDIFFPLYKGVEEFEMQIFNRWGELLFETTDIHQGWDGYYKGQICQQDVYVWRVSATFQDGGDFTDMGDVTLIR